MVCHESYKDKNGDWLYPSEVEKLKDNTYVKIHDKSKVIVGLPSPCLNQKILLTLKS